MHLKKEQDNPTLVTNRGSYRFIIYFILLVKPLKFCA